MTVQPIIQLSEHEARQRSGALRQHAQPVVDFGPDLKYLIDDLEDTLRSSPIGVGLAAPQIGKLLRVAVVNVSEGKRDPSLVVINPKVITESGKKSTMQESCLSIPHFKGPVVRRHKLEMVFLDVNGQEQHLKATGFLARVLSHEIDHLEGILYPDRLEANQKLEHTDLFHRSA